MATQGSVAARPSTVSPRNGGRKWAANHGVTSVRFNYVSSAASKERGKPRRRRACGRQNRKRRTYSALDARRPPPIIAAATPNAVSLRAHAAQHGAIRFLAIFPLPHLPQGNWFTKAAIGACGVRPKVARSVPRGPALVSLTSDERSKARGRRCGCASSYRAAPQPAACS
jgi:hypothetical protein